MFRLNGLKFDINTQHVIGDTQYPRGWFLVASNRDAIGLVEVADPVKPDTKLFDVTENPDGTYTATPRNPAVIAAENAAIARQAASIRIAAIKDELVEHLATNLAGTPAEKAQALAAIGTLRAELALEKAKL